MNHLKLFENFLDELNENIRIIYKADDVSDKAKEVWKEETEKRGLRARSSYSPGNYINAEFRDGKMRITVDKKDAGKIKPIVSKIAGNAEMETQKWNPNDKKWEVLDSEGAKKAEDDAKTEAKKKGEDVKKALGENPSVDKVADYVWKNWKKITGQPDSAKNEEGQFPDEVVSILSYYKIDYTDFSDAWNEKGETLNEASVQIAGRQKPSGAKVLATVIVDRLEDQNFLKLDNVRLKNLVISDLTDLIMDSTF